VRPVFAPCPPSAWQRDGVVRSMEHNDESPQCVKSAHGSWLLSEISEA